MTQPAQSSMTRLLEYAARFLRVRARPNESICVTVEQVAAFASQLRDGCKQDLIRLIVGCVNDNLYSNGKDALLALAQAIEEGATIEFWGLPDCACGKNDCVYCGRGYATAPTKEKP